MDPSPPEPTQTVLDADARRARRIQIDGFLDRALDLPAGERAAFLERQCPTGLRADVERMLAEMTDEAADTLEQGAFRGPLAFQMAREIQSSRPLEEGDQVGAFQVIRELGRGGMAVVYLADRVDGAFRQQVALKVMLEPQRSPRQTARFHLERQILAELRHPNIAQLLDGGLTDQDRPYFAMEWVDGHPIDLYCDRYRLSVHDRLRLFVQVTRAVAAAHRSLVIHRDIKPSNILVSSGPDATSSVSPESTTSEEVTPEGTAPGPDGAQVKLLDFGIAKILDAEELDERHQLTRTSAMPMTPEYASPEQLMGEPLTTASDIYQLGILLFQLLCGSRPFENLSFAERIARDHQPSRPSTVLTIPSSEAIAESRSTTRKALIRQLSGDLENIVLKTLRRRPERRYTSATALVEDVEAFLEGRPISARADSAVYRAQKFVARNRWSTALVACLLVALLGLSALSTARLRRERDVAQAAQARAEDAVTEAEQVVEFLIGLFEASRRGAKQAESISALDLINTGSEKIETELKDQPRIRARFLSTLGSVHRSLALFDQAEAMAREALELNGQVFGTDSLQVATSLDLLAGILSRRGEQKEAEQINRRALAIREAALDPMHPDIADSLNSLATVYWNEGRYDEVEPLLQRSLEIRRHQLGPDHEQTAAIHKNLCILLRTLDRLSDAEENCRRAVDGYRKSLGESHPRVAGALNTLALLRVAQGRRAEAEPLYLQALDIWQASLGEQHVNTTAAMENLGGLYVNQGEYKKAEPLYRRSLEIHEATYGPDHFNLTRTLQNLGNCLLRQERYEEAEPHFRRAIALFDATGPSEHPEIARPLLGLATVLLQKGQSEQAEALAKRSHQLRIKVFGEDHPELGDSYRVLGNIYRETGRFDQAEASYLEALERYGDGKNPQKLRWTVDGYSDLLRRLGRTDEAVEIQAKYPDRRLEIPKPTVDPARG